MLGMFSKRNRPLHMGRFPMEKIKQVDEPTTLITGDIKRVPKRAGFFVRAFSAISAPRRERRSAAHPKNPLNAAMGHVHWTQVPVHKGEPYTDPAELPDDRADRKTHQIALLFPRPDMVGIRVPRLGLVQRDLDGEPIGETPYRRRRQRPALGNLDPLWRRLGIWRAELPGLSERIDYGRHRCRLYPPARL